MVQPAGRPDGGSGGPAADVAAVGAGIGSDGAGMGRLGRFFPGIPAGGSPAGGRPKGGSPAGRDLGGRPLGTAAGAAGRFSDCARAAAISSWETSAEAISLTASR